MMFFDAFPVRKVSKIIGFSKNRRLLYCFFAGGLWRGDGLFVE
nr:MAG TPA: hypothetical protein [Bacteriophage sp.]DAL58132.1 MAG TPA_asm: hypothetical protein [Bacteriophage sp.]